MGALLLVLRPLIPYLLVAVALSGTVTGFYFKIRHDEKVRVLAQVEKEKQDAIQKGKAARDRIRTLCDSNPTNCVPDDWFRDD